MASNYLNCSKFFLISPIICGIAASILFVVKDPSRYCTSFLDCARWAALFLLPPLLLLLFVREKGVYNPSSASSPPPPLPLTSSSVVPERKYDVFVSFRGTDIRSTFLSHLLKALLEKKVETFVDYKLREGDEISPTLIRAILESEISLVVFSKDYAASKWCLEELAQIIECMENYGQIVIPIFYHIDPSNVRHQTGSYKDAFAKHKGRLKKHDMSKLQMWRTALEKAANLSGFHSSNHK